MKKGLITILIASGVLTAFTYTGCYYDKSELLYPLGNCDTTATVSYSQNIVTLFEQASCYSCHKGNSPSGGISMGTYAADKALVDNGKLYGSITHASGYKEMPKDLSKMTDCKIATIKKWIDAGAPNN